VGKAYRKVKERLSLYLWTRRILSPPFNKPLRVCWQINMFALIVVVYSVWNVAELKGTIVVSLEEYTVPNAEQ
jgi:hypothetical protein